jgi:hypothetical protein
MTDLKNIYAFLKVEMSHSKDRAGIEVKRTIDGSHENLGVMIAALLELEPELVNIISAALATHKAQDNG